MLPSLPVVPFLIRILRSSSSESVGDCIKKRRNKILKNVFILGFRTNLILPFQKENPLHPLFFSLVVFSLKYASSV
ncbi:hypothetical protein LEP1GSC166_2150 [Leptospira kirschneri]|nr:hypothetical protein LEP1GSC198_0470 [Leptospira kirschneri str. JB]EMK09260.1 hypothetical protein LEP1GSC166_2150 [Leptospira kirschneri]